MRVLTVRHPWASLLIHGTKRVENRTWPTAYRGPVAIHTSTKPEPRQRWQHRLNLLDVEGLPQHPGCIIGVAELTDVHRAGGCCPIWGFQEADGRPVWHWMLVDPQPIDPPIPHRGRLGLWKPSVELSAAIGEQLSKEGAA